MKQSGMNLSEMELSEMALSEMKKNLNASVHDSLLSAFDSIRIVSLTERTDRRKEIMQEFSTFGMIPGQGVTTFFDAIRPADAGGFPSIGARGCYLSHLQVLRQARDQGVARLLVLEDDAMFLPELRQASRLVEFCQTERWDFLYPGHYLPAESGPLRWIQTDANILCTHAYALHHRAIPALIGFLEECLARPPGDPAGGPMHLDAAYSTFRLTHPTCLTFRASHSLILQRSSSSDVSGPSRAQGLIPPVVLKYCRQFKNWFRRYR